MMRTSGGPMTNKIKDSKVRAYGSTRIVRYLHIYDNKLPILTHHIMCNLMLAAGVGSVRFWESDDE